MGSKENQPSTRRYLEVSAGLLIWIISPYNRRLERLMWKSKPEMWLLVTLVGYMPTIVDLVLAHL